MTIILHATRKLQASQRRSCHKGYLPGHTISAFAGTKSRDGTSTTKLQILLRRKSKGKKEATRT